MSIPTSEEKKIQLILKVNSAQIIPTRIYQFQLTKKTKCSYHEKLTPHGLLE